MTPRTTILSTAVLAATVLLAPAADAQTPIRVDVLPPFPAADTTVKSVLIPGLRAGPSAFPATHYEEMRPKVPGQIDWQHYHTRQEIEWFMKKWARDYPNLVELYSVGESFGGTPILQVTVTNKETGAHTDKPAAFFEGGRHSGEITATESAFYLLWYVLDRYGKDAEVTRLLDQKTLYIRPSNNPDGADLYKLTAQANRSTVRPIDNDDDGLLDEDPGDDLDGDGFIRQVRKYVGENKGNATVDPNDPSGRLMRRVAPGTGDYELYQEGIDNDGDGRVNEDGVGGLDLHRNYPMNWRPEPGLDATGRGYTQFGAGAYPLSEPETRAVFDWLVRHPNVGVVNTMDTSVPMHLRGPSTCDDWECVFPEDLKHLQHFDSVGLTITDYPWAGNTYREYSTRGRIVNERGDTLRPNPLFGHSPDFGYFWYGAIWYGDELWNGGRERDYNNDGDIDQYEVLRYCDEQFGGTCFKPWTKGTHPVHGEVEYGGYNPKFFSQNGPPAALERWAGRQAMFNLYMAQSLPKVEIVNATVHPVTTAGRDSATHEIRVTVRNTGRLPTALEQAKRVKIVRPDRIAVEAPRGSRTRLAGRMPEFWLDGGETETIAVRIRAGTRGEDRNVTVRLLSTRGGVAERAVRW